MTAHTPLRCSNSVMTLDTTLSPNKIVLLNTGNYPSFSSYLNETWLFNGTGTPDWTNTSATLVDASGPLPGRTGHIMSFDGANVMLYGGQGTTSSAGVFQDTWTWNGTTWTKQNPATVPFGRFGAESTFLAGTGVVMFGGAIANGQLLNETWVWNGTTWSQVTVANGTGPGARVGHAMASGTVVKNQVILFGGRGNKYQSNSTWSFATGAWTELLPVTKPSIRSECVMSYDTTNNVYVLFGGQNEYNYLDETWTFNGVTWTQVAVANGVGPSGRINAQMAFDSVSQRTILFGGINATTNYPANDTWSFNAATGVWSIL